MGEKLQLPKYISEAKTCFKIHFHGPDKKAVHASVGHVRLGKKKALKKAIQRRNELLKDAWGDLWQQVLNGNNYSLKLPRTLEPTLQIDKRGNEYYQAMWCDDNGNRHCRKRSIEKHGKLGAYLALKRIILDAHAKRLSALVGTGRIQTVNLL